MGCRPQSCPRELYSLAFAYFIALAGALAERKKEPMPLAYLASGLPRRLQ